jgi:myo-inositol-1(or 4)-monophosphatase
MTVDARGFASRHLAACALARSAGEIARRRFLNRASFTVGFKGPQDFLTEVDGEIERFLAQRLGEAFPEDGFLGEEQGKGRAAEPGAPTWVVDPIDGTANFARGVAPFCVSIAAVRDREVEVGVIYDPLADELFAARRGGGATVNDAPLRAGTTRDLAVAAIEVAWSQRAPEASLRLIGRVAATGAAPMHIGTAALALAYVAAGRRDGYAAIYLNAWDCLAGVALVSEAGGYVSDFLAGDGLARGGPIVACAPGLKEVLLATAQIEGLTP